MRIPIERMQIVREGTLIYDVPDESLQTANVVANLVRA